MSCGIDCKRGSDLALLWLWCRLVATAPTGHLAWEPPYAMGVALEKAKKKKKRKEKKTQKQEELLIKDIHIILEAGKETDDCLLASEIKSS